MCVDSRWEGVRGEGGVGRSMDGEGGQYFFLTLTIRALVTACGVRNSEGVAIFAAAVVAGAAATLYLCLHTEELSRIERRGGAGHADGDDDTCAVGKDCMWTVSVLRRA